MVIIVWESKHSKWMLVPVKYTLDFLLVQQKSRSMAGPNCFEPGTPGMVRQATLVLSKSRRFNYVFY